MFEKEKKQYEEDCKTHDRPWELWEYKEFGKGGWADLQCKPKWIHLSLYRRKITAFVPEYYSGLNWRDAEQLIGKTVECTNNPDSGWYVGILKAVKENDGIIHFVVKVNGCLRVDFFIYIRICEETFKHPTINIAGVELPEPETVAPSHGTKYWTFPGCICHIWNGFTREMDFLKARRVHITEDRAKKWEHWWKSMVIDKMERN